MCVVQFVDWMKLRRTLNGVDIAPRSELSPPVRSPSPEATPVVAQFQPERQKPKKALTLKFSSKSVREVPLQTVFVVSSSLFFF